MDLQSTLPWTQRPLLINAPMGGFANADLAIAVSQAGGLGQIGADGDIDDLEAQLLKAEQKLDRVNGLLPIGVGILTFVLNGIIVKNPERVLALLQRFKPAVVWLFAAKDLGEYATWARDIRDSLPDSQVWVQIGSVEGALTLARDTRPDVISVQGSDAGGHGFAKGAGIISLLPEVADALEAAGFGSIALVAAGGIADGRAAAAAFTLGAQGVVVGTRFLAASETKVHPEYRAAILQASDGGQTTVRAKLFDELRGKNIWPGPYDGRSLRMQSFQDFSDGVEIDEIRRRHAEAIKSDAEGFAVDGQGRAAMWCGTGVGLIKAEQPAAEIVADLRRGIVEAMRAVQGKL